MGMFDWFFQSEMARLEDNLTNMYVQESERKYAIQQLREMASEEAVDVLIKRFGETAPNTTVDIEEKEYVYDVLVELGKETDLEVADKVIDHLRETEEKINWPMKVVKDLLDYDEMNDLICELLGDDDREYMSNPEKKQELMLQASELQSRELAEKLVPYLEDSNETIRFLAVDAVENQDYPSIIEEPLRERLAEEHSLRVVKKVAEIFSEHSDWKIPEDEQADVEQALPEEYGIHKEGHIYQRRI
ncbi:MAG: hypothetical protein ABEL76_15735 [Bradymonadaceae bacterium]